MSTADSADGEPLVFGLPAGELVAALRGAGLGEDAVVAMVGQAIARSSGIEAAPGAGFTFQTQIALSAAECISSYQRLFVHPDFVDGVTVVQAQSTPEEIGFNARFHGIEGEFDGIARDLHLASNCVAELRRELFGLARELEAKITEIDSRLDAKGKDKDSKDTKEGKDGKDTKDKDSKEGKDGKEGKDKEGKDTKEGKDGKEHKDGKETKEGKDHVDKVGQLEKVSVDKTALPVPGAALDVGPQDAIADSSETDPGTERTFIRLEDRPPVGEDAVREPDEKGE
jgi:hypothetical protein